MIFENGVAGAEPPTGTRGGSPTLSPFPGERGLGIGIINHKFISKIDFFYKLRPLRENGGVKFVINVYY